MTDSTLDILIATLADPTTEKPARRQAAADLAALNDPRAIPPLLEAACTLQAAEEALARMGQMVILPMVTALNDANPKIQRTARNVLARLGYDAERLPPDLQAITHLNASLEKLVSAAQTNNEIGLTQAIQALTPAGTHALEPILLLLWHEDGRVRSAAVRVLGGIRDPRAQEALADALQDADERVRMNAIQGITRNWGGQGMEGLAKIARNANETGRLRVLAALAIGEVIGDDILAMQAGAVLDTLMKNPAQQVSESKLQELLWMIEVALGG